MGSFRGYLRAMSGKPSRGTILRVQSRNALVNGLGLNPKT